MRFLWRRFTFNGSSLRLGYSRHCRADNRWHRFARYRCGLRFRRQRFGSSRFRRVFGEHGHFKIRLRELIVREVTQRRELAREIAVWASPQGGFGRFSQRYRNDERPVFRFQRFRRDDAQIQSNSRCRPGHFPQIQFALHRARDRICDFDTVLPRDGAALRQLRGRHVRLSARPIGSQRSECVLEFGSGHQRELQFCRRRLLNRGRFCDGRLRHLCVGGWPVATQPAVAQPFSPGLEVAAEISRSRSASPPVRARMGWGQSVPFRAMRARH